MVVSNASKRARYANSISNQHTEKKFGLPFQIGRGSWSNIFTPSVTKNNSCVKCCDLSLMNRKYNPLILIDDTNNLFKIEMDQIGYITYINLTNKYYSATELCDYMNQKIIEAGYYYYNEYNEYDKISQLSFSYDRTQDKIIINLLTHNYIINNNYKQNTNKSDWSPSDNSFYFYKLELLKTMGFESNQLSVDNYYNYNTNQTIYTDNHPIYDNYPKI